MQLGFLVAAMTFTLLAVMLVGCGRPATTERETTPTVPKTITFPDENLEAAIRDALGKPVGEEITSEELAGIAILEANESAILGQLFVLVESTDVGTVDKSTMAHMCRFWPTADQLGCELSALPQP